MKTLNFENSYAKNKQGNIIGPITQQKMAENDGTAVTVICITYNHEKFIAQALDSFLMQKTNFKFKVFVGEDCGPDNTAAIVREYAERYPDIIIPFIREHNMGAQRNLIDLCQRATSPYIAFCEGDDYWIDEYKLQKQFDYMEQNQDIRVCFAQAEIEAPEDWFLSSYFKKNNEGKFIYPECEPIFVTKKEKLNMYDFIKCFSAHTSTIFYRWNYDLDIPEWYFNGIIGDVPIFLMQLDNRNAYYMKKVVSIYRRSNVGIFMSSNMDEHFMRTRMDQFWDSWQELSVYPDSRAARQAVLSRGETLVDSIHQRFASLDGVKKMVDGDVVATVKQVNPLTMLEAMGAHVQHLHLSDFTSTCDCAVPGFGAEDFEAVAKKLRAIHFDGTAILEVYRSGFGEAQELAEGLSFLNRIFIDNKGDEQP